MYKDTQGMVKSIPVLGKANTNHGAIGMVDSAFSAIYSTPPIRSQEFIANLGEQIGIKSAKAQVGGSGNAVLSPIFNLWEASRNFAYLAMIMVFLIIGFMVMFRQKLNPQTVVTVQLALPGLVIGLVMITFSYFIASLIADTAFIGTNVVGYFFASAQKTNPQPLTDRLATQSSIDAFSPYLGMVKREQAETMVASVYERLDAPTQNYLSIFAALLTAQFIAPIGSALPPPLNLYATPIFGVLSGGAGYFGTTWVISWVIAIAAFLALIYQMLKLLMRLITSYLTIIFLTITAPFQLLVASLPGRQQIATDWMLNLLGNVLVFPAVLAVFYFVALLLGRDFATTATSGLLGNPNLLVDTALAQEKITVVGNSAFPLLGGLDLSVLQVLLAFGSLMALPTIPDLVVKAVGKMGQAGQAVSNEVMGAYRTGQGYSNQSQGALSSNFNQQRKAIMGDSSPHWNPAANDGKGAWVYSRGPSLWGHAMGERLPGLTGAAKSTAQRGTVAGRVIN